MSTADPAAELSPPDLTDRLPDDPATLKGMIRELLAALRDSQHDNESLRHRLDLLLRRLYGPRGERFDPSQTLLFADANTDPEATQPAPEPAEEEKSKRKCKPHGRRQMPDDLPHEPRHHELTQAERVCPCCGRVRLDIGVEQSDQLEYRPATLFVIEHLIHKYACSHCCKAPPPAIGPLPQPGLESEPASPLTAPAMTPEPASRLAAPAATPETIDPPPQPPSTPCRLVDPAQVVIAATKPAMPIAKGLPGPGLLAHVIVSKFVDHLPLYRLERIYERQGLFLARSTLCDWMAACADLLRPLYDRLVAAVLQSRVIHTDDTIVKMQELKTHLLRNARLWTYLGDEAHPYNVFDFTQTRKRDGPQRFLANYQGYLQADAFSGYDCLYLPDPGTTMARIIEVACHAHARRKFFEARDKDALRSAQALAYFGQLYEIERQATAKGFDAAIRLQMRQDLAVPILDKFHTWLEEQRAVVWPKNPLAEAINYALHNWTALVRYTEAAFLAIDNNVAEREMKRIAIGRKNWLFVGSPKGGKTAAILVSITSTCHRLGVEPWAYLNDVLARLPSTPESQLAELMPDRWQAARQTAAATAAADTATPVTESAT